MNYLDVIILVYLCSLNAISERCKIMRSGTDILSDCSSMGLTKVPRNIPKNTTILDLSENNLNIIRNFSFNWLANVHTLRLQSSRITSLEVHAFLGLNSLQHLNLNSNFLETSDTSFPPGLFRQVPNLLFLDITNNLFEKKKKYPDETLKDLRKLQTLRMNGILGAQFGLGFRSLTNLSSLFLYPCFIKELLNETFVNFRDLPITRILLRCRLNKIEPGALQPMQSIKYLEIPGNRFLRISNLLVILSTLKDKNLNGIYFQDNYEERHGPDIIRKHEFSFLGAVCVNEINLQNNQLSIIEKGSIKGMKYKNCLEKLDLSNNNIYGDIDIVFELFKLTSLKELILSDQDPTTASRSIVEHRKNINRIMLSNNYSVSYMYRLPPKIERIIANNIVIHSTPLNSLNFTSGNNVVFLDLSWTHFSRCDAVLNGLKNLENLSISGFNCSILNPNLISSFKKLRTLESKSASLGIGLRKDTKGVFLKGLKNLEQLDLSGNGFKTLYPAMLQSQYNSLKSIILADNELTSLPFDLSKFSKLEKIDLRNNRINYLNDETIERLDTLSTRVGVNFYLYIFGNSFQCNCKSLQFIKWLFQNNIILDSGGNYSCVYIDGSTKSTFYAFRNIDQLTKECVSKFWLILSVCVMFLLMIFIAGATVIYKYRITLHYWYLYIRRKYRMYSKLEDDGTEYKYNAFIAYHNDNYQWVCGPLLNYLESEKKLTLCLHDRDFVLGNLIIDNIFDAIAQSKKVILVINKRFLESKWCEYELDLSRMRMSRENKEILIVVLMEKILPKEMPESLLKIWNKITCLEADEYTALLEDPSYHSLFWKRLYESIMM